MNDLLVKLYELPEAPAPPEGVTIRRALVPERSVVAEWVASNFSRAWADECWVATSGHPVSCFVATVAGEGGGALAGFACYGATFREFFGPVGVGEKFRQRGIGSALTLAALQGLREEGFAYGIIGATKDAEYYAKLVGATVIDESSPGAYRGMLR